MDLKLMMSTFILVFLAEIGDKTQLATMVLATERGGRMSVFLGSALALTASAAIAVLLGSLVGELISPLWMKRIAGAAFIVMGIALLVSWPSTNDPSTLEIQAEESVPDNTLDK
jgi:putative Ca2+/H+ antiporter (TMEM165/GDT1 family)